MITDFTVDRHRYIGTTRTEHIPIPLPMLVPRLGGLSDLSSNYLGWAMENMIGGMAPLAVL